jgi:hypothetical protein
MKPVGGSRSFAVTTELRKMGWSVGSEELNERK